MGDAGDTASAASLRAALARAASAAFDGGRIGSAGVGRKSAKPTASAATTAAAPSASLDPDDFLHAPELPGGLLLLGAIPFPFLGCALLPFSVIKKKYKSKEEPELFQPAPQRRGPQAAAGEGTGDAAARR